MKILNDLFSSHGAVILSAEELKNVKGGYGSYTCYCGFTGGDYEDQPETVTANSLEDALTKTNLGCGMTGATCSGDASIT